MILMSFLLQLTLTCILHFWALSLIYNHRTGTPEIFPFEEHLTHLTSFLSVRITACSRFYKSFQWILHFMMISYLVTQR